MEGYILLDQNGARLTHGRWWFVGGQGWVWSGDEVAQILESCREWNIKPAFVQCARLSDDRQTVETIGTPIPVRL